MKMMGENITKTLKKELKYMSNVDRIIMDCLAINFFGKGDDIGLYTQRQDHAPTEFYRSAEQRRHFV